MTLLGYLRCLALVLGRSGEKQFFTHHLQAICAVTGYHHILPQLSLFPPRLLHYLVPPHLKGSPSISRHSCCSSLNSSPVVSCLKWRDLNCTKQASVSKQVIYAVAQQHCLLFSIMFLLHLNNLIIFLTAVKQQADVFMQPSITS